MGSGTGRTDGWRRAVSCRSPEATSRGPPPEGGSDLGESSMGCVIAIPSRMASVASRSCISRYQGHGGSAPVANFSMAQSRTFSKSVLPMMHSHPLPLTNRFIMPLVQPSPQLAGPLPRRTTSPRSVRQVWPLGPRRAPRLYSSLTLNLSEASL